MHGTSSLPAPADAFAKVIGADESLAEKAIHAAVDHAVADGAELVHLVTAVVMVRECEHDSQLKSLAIPHNCAVAMQRITALEDTTSGDWTPPPMLLCRVESVDIYGDINDPDVEESFRVVVRRHADGLWRYKVTNAGGIVTLFSYDTGYSTEAEAREAGADRLSDYTYWIVNRSAALTV